MYLRWRKAGIASVLLGSVLAPGQLFAVARDDISELQAEIQNQKAEVENINQQLEAYKGKIAEYQKKGYSLATDIALLENEQAMTELDIAGTQAQITEQQLEVQLLQEHIAATDARLATERALLKDVLFAVRKQDQRGGIVEMLFSAKDFNDVFRTASQLADVNADLQKALVATQQTRTTLHTQRSEREEKLAYLTSLEQDLTKKTEMLEGQHNAKIVLMSETAESEQEYRELVSELRQEQQAVSARISALQESITARLANADTSGDTSTLSWPLFGRITTTFHDPTYPFRNLFEHSGLDIAIPQGTPIEASAPGIVAWARTGRMYGNYVMIIHANGLATLYAHMSRIDVVQDQYVSRGQIIGLSGGRAGSPGAGFSTGPHLHFEIREDGIPVDPYKYLP